MPGKWCIVCEYGFNPGETRHYFPKNPEKAEKWRIAMNVPSSDRTLHTQIICAKHFDSECFSRNGILTSRAFPTLLPRPPEPPKPPRVLNQPLKDFAAIEDIQQTVNSVTTPTTQESLGAPSILESLLLGNRKKSNAKTESEEEEPRSPTPDFTYPVIDSYLRKVAFKPGINPSVFKYLEQMLKDSTELDRMCTVMFQDIRLREHLEYNPVTDCLDGLQDYGDQQPSEMNANYALVFMAQGINVEKAWKLPLAYYLTRNRVSPKHLQRIILEVLEAITNAHLEVVCIVSEMTASICKTMTAIGSTVQAPRITHNNRSVFTMVDPPFILNCTRNFLRKHPVELQVQLPDSPGFIPLEAQWSHVESAVKKDLESEKYFRHLEKITEAHLEPITTKVKLATELMNRSVARYLNTLAKLGDLPIQAMATAKFIEEVDQVFDSLNTDCCISSTSSHHNLWQKVVKDVEAWRYPPQVGFHWSFRDGWRQSIAAFQQMWLHLSPRVKYLRPRSFNLDPLRDFLKAVQVDTGSVHASSTEFVGSFKREIVKDYLGGFNDDHDEVRARINDYFGVVDNNIDRITEEIATTVSVNWQGGPFNYVSGYIAKKLLESSDIYCENCCNNLIDNSLKSCHSLVVSKKYSYLSKLSYAGPKLISTIDAIVKLVKREVCSCYAVKNIRKHLAGKIREKNYFTWFSCQEHFLYVETGIIESVCRIIVPLYCKRIIRELKAQSASANGKKADKGGEKRKLE